MRLLHRTNSKTVVSLTALRPYAPSRYCILQCVSSLDFKGRTLLGCGLFFCPTPTTSPRIIARL
jgi:hypothetical protein